MQTTLSKCGGPGAFIAAWGGGLIDGLMFVQALSQFHGTGLLNLGLNKGELEALIALSSHHLCLMANLA